MAACDKVHGAIRFHFWDCIAPTKIFYALLFTIRRNTITRDIAGTRRPKCMSEQPLIRPVPLQGSAGPFFLSHLYGYTAK
jgi:hypothetical protein